MPVERAFSQKVAPVPLDALAVLVRGNEIHELGENGLAGVQGAVLLLPGLVIPSPRCVKARSGPLVEGSFPSTTIGNSIFPR